MQIKIVAAAVLVDNNQHVLIAKRPENKPMAGLWEFPGGKVESHESPEAALCRELKEELGITCNQAALEPLTFCSHRYDDFHLLMPMYKIQTWDGEVQNLEHAAIAWVKADELSNYSMPPADEPLIDFLKNHFRV